MSALSNVPGGLSIPPKQSFTGSVLTAIHPSDAQTGLKNVQSVTVNSDGSYTIYEPYVGSTDFGLFKKQGSSKGTWASVDIKGSNFTINMRGHFTSAAYRLTARTFPKPIDYNVHVGGNFITHQTWAWGKHDGYPSGVVFGGGQRIYEWHQNTTQDLAPPMEQSFATGGVGW